MAKSPGNGQIYRDTISRCDMYSNPYNTHLSSHPALVRQRAEEYARSKDVIESGQKKLERDLMERLMQKMPTGKFVVVAHLGKYAFLAIMLPPYIFLYGLPKWLMTVGVPWAFNAMKKNGKSLLLRLAKPLKDALQIIQKPILALLQAAKDRMERTRAGLNKLGQKAYGAVTYPWKLMHDKVIQPFIQAYKFLAASIKSIDTSTRKLFESIKEQMMKRWQAISSFTQLIRDKVKTPKHLLSILGNSFSLAYSWLTEKMEKLKKFPERIFENLKEQIRKIQDVLIRKPSELIKRSLESAQNFAKKAYHQTMKKISEWTEPFLNAIQNALSKRKNWNEILRKFKREGILEGCKQAGKVLVSGCKRGMKIVAKIVAEFSADLVQLLPLPVVALFTPFLQMGRAFIKIPSKIYGARRGALQKIKHLKNLFFGGLKWMNSGIKYLISKIVKVYKRLKPKFLSFVAQGFSFLAWLFSICLEALKRFTYLIRLMITWMKVFFQYGMAQVREQAQRFFQ